MAVISKRQRLGQVAGQGLEAAEMPGPIIFGQIESDRVGTAAAVSVVLLAISLVVLLGISALSQWGRRHDVD